MKTQTARTVRATPRFVFVMLFLASLSRSGCRRRGGDASPPDASSAIQAARHQFDQGNYSAAVTALQQAVAQNSSSAEAYYWLGRSYYEIRDYDNSVEQAEKSVSFDPKNSLYHQWLGRAYGGKADRDRSFSLAKKVKAEFREAVNLNPSNIEARRDLEQYCLDAPWIAGGSKDEALQQVNAIAALDPVQGHLARAVYDREGPKKLDDAESEMRQVLAAKPKTADPYFEVADFFADQNKPSDIIATTDAAAQVAPNDPRLGILPRCRGRAFEHRSARRRARFEELSRQRAGPQRLAVPCSGARMARPALRGAGKARGSGGAVSCGVAVGTETQGCQGTPRKA